jgi:hypothetical protein
MREMAANMRAPYLRATHMPAYASRRWQVTGRSPDELLDGALAELGRPEAEQGNPDAWRNRLELSALAQYHLTAYQALKRDPMGSPGADKRGPQEILTLMLQDERGLRTLRQAVTDGRAGRAPRMVDTDGQVTHGEAGDDGEILPDPDGPEVLLTDQWLRYDGYPSGGRPVRPASMPTDTPLMKASRLQHDIVHLIDQVAKYLDELDRLESPSGGMLLDQIGWPGSDTKNTVEMLIEAQAKLGYWGKVAARQLSRTEPPLEGEPGDEYDEEVDDEYDE